MNAEKLLGAQNKIWEDVKENTWEVEAQFGQWLGESNPDVSEEWVPCNKGRGWFGFNKEGDSMASISIKLKARGTARLKFGNCGNGDGFVRVYLNNVEIAAAGTMDFDRTIEFDFQYNDPLKITEDGTGSVILFSDFIIENCEEGCGVIKFNSIKKQQTSQRLDYDWSLRSCNSKQFNKKQQIHGFICETKDYMQGNTITI